MRDVLLYALAAAGFLLLGVVLTWPLAVHLTTHVPGTGAGDNITFIWNFWWMREALASDAVDFFWTTAIFHPFGTSLVAHSHTAMTAFVGATLLSGVSIVAAQNLILIGAVALNGFSTYLLAYHLTSRRDTSALAGIFFASAPYFAGHLHGHFNLVPAWMLPLFCLTWLRSIASAARIWIVASGVLLVLTAYSDYYYLVYLLAFVLLTVVAQKVRLERSRRVPVPPTTIDRVLLGLAGLLVAVALVIAVTGGGRFSIGPLVISARSGLNIRTAAWCALLVWVWRRWRPGLHFSTVPAPGLLPRLNLMAGVFLVGAAPLIISAVRLWWSGDYVSQQYFWRSAPEGVDLAGLVAGNPFHPVWGLVARNVYSLAAINPIESTAWIGVGALAALPALRKEWVSRRDARIWIWTAIAFGIWALGPHLTVLGAKTGLLLPELLLRYVPIAANARIPGRAMVMVYLSLAVLMALALASHRASRATLVLLASLVLADFFSAPIPLHALDRPLVYQQLATMPAGAVLDLPFGVRDGFGEIGALDHRTLYYQTIHGKPIAGGFVARLSTSISSRIQSSSLVRTLLRLSAGESVSDADLAAGRDESRQLFAVRSIRYVVVDESAASTALRSYVATLPVRLVSKQGGRALYIVEP